jgi:hypothetical protein
MKLSLPRNYISKLFGLLSICIVSSGIATAQNPKSDMKLPKATFCGVEQGYSQEELRQLPWADNNQFLVDFLRGRGINVPEDYIEQIKAVKKSKGGYQPRTLTREEIHPEKAGEAGRASAASMVYVPVKAWIYRRTDGTGARSVAQVQVDIAELNAEFDRSNVPVNFYLKCDIGYVSDSYLYDRPDSGALDYMWRTYLDASAINVHFVNEPGTASSIGGGTWAGIARRPSLALPTPTFVMALSRLTNSSTFAHEMGHALGLAHTHQARDQSNSVLYNSQSGDCYQEPYSRTRTQEFACLSTWGDKKAEVNGDAILDTPGDPGLYVGSSPQISLNAAGRYYYSAGFKDRWGDAWQPDVYNMMSYGAQIYTTQVGTFTPSQAAIMTYFANKIATPGAALTITGPATACPGIYQFSVVSAPATSYVWSVPFGWSLTQQGTSNVLVTVPSGTAAGLYTVAVQPGCGYAMATYTVRVGFPAATVSGPILVCRTSSEYYSVPNVSGATYQWFAPAGWYIETPTASATVINADYNAVAGAIGVRVTLCNTPSSISKTVRLRDPDIDGNCTPVVNCLLPSCRVQAVAGQTTNTEQASWTVEATPNPASDRILVRTSRSGPATSTLLNSYGRTVRQKAWTGTGTLQMSLADLPRGLYLLQVNQGGKRFIKHIELH